MCIHVTKNMVQDNLYHLFLKRKVIYRGNIKSESSRRNNCFDHES